MAEQRRNRTPEETAAWGFHSGKLEEAAAAPVRRRKKRRLFAWGLLLYTLALLAAAGFGLGGLWRFLDIYERSLPHKAVEALLEQTDGPGWRELLSERGVEDSFLDTLDLEHAGYYKRLELYSEERPAYGIRFGKKTMLTAYMAPGETLDESRSTWEIDSLEVVPSGLRVYVPEGAVITVEGEPVGADALKRQNAQPLALGPLEAGREDVAGLYEYVLDDVYAPEGLAVKDRLGNALELAYSGENAYYYAPLTASYTVTAPASAAVSVNGVVLTEENAEILRQPLEDFEGLEAYVGELPAQCTYTVEGLVERPLVTALLPDGTALAPAEETERRWVYEMAGDPALLAEQEDYILRVLDAYMAYSGNRGNDVVGNYNRYSVYLYPGSEAADRASRARESIAWVRNRNSYPEAVTVLSAIRWTEGCWSARLSFTVPGDEEGEAKDYVILFYRTADWEQWRVIRIMNKSAFR